MDLSSIYQNSLFEVQISRSWLYLFQQLQNLNWQQDFNLSVPQKVLDPPSGKKLTTKQQTSTKINLVYVN
jgi:hypothetical protein